MLSDPGTGFDLSGQRRSYGEGAVDAALAICTLVAGMFFPVVSAIASPDGFVNAIWGSLYGIGFGFLHSAIGEYRGGIAGVLYVAAGFFIWPALVAYSVKRLLRLIDRKRAPTLWWSIRALLLLSLFAAIPIPNVQGGPWEHFPIFTKYIDF